MTLSPTYDTDALLIEGQGAKWYFNLESVSPFITMKWLQRTLILTGHADLCHLFGR